MGEPYQRIYIERKQNYTSQESGRLKMQNKKTRGCNKASVITLEDQDRLLEP